MKISVNRNGSEAEKVTANCIFIFEDLVCQEIN